MGLFRSTGDNSRANTISDKDWKSWQDRAAKANPQRTRFGTAENVKAARHGRDNFRQAQRGNN